jgi:hypothetical protein
MSSSDNTQLTPVQGYNTDRMIFSDPINGTIPDSRPKIEFKRINISTKNEDGTHGELILPTTRLFSFGVSENTSQETGKVNGYTFPLCLWNRDGPTPEEQEWTNTFERVVAKCIDYLVANKEEIELFDLSRADLTKSKGGLNPLYWKKEKFTNEAGKSSMRVVPGTGPTLYTKLIYSKKHDKFLSQFFDQTGEGLDALALMNKYCYTKAAIKVESIFIGSKISLQVKLYEAVIEPTSNGMRRLLDPPRPITQSKVIMHDAASSNPLTITDSVGGDDDTNSIFGSDNDVPEDDLTKSQPQEKPPQKRIVKKVIRKSTQES